MWPKDMLHHLLCKLGLRRSWPVIEGRVDSCQWVQDRHGLGPSAGHYDVTFVYRTADPSDRTVEQGSFCHPGARHIAPYAKGEAISIQYNPKKPARYYVAEDTPNYEKLEAILVVTLFSLIAGYLLLNF